MKSSPTLSPHKRARAAHGIQRRLAMTVGLVSLTVVGALAWALMRWVDTLLAGHPVEDWDAAHQTILFGAAGLLALIQLLLFLVGHYVQRRVTRPAAALARAAERVAAGDLTKTDRVADGDDEMGRLSRAAQAMLLELRRLVSTIRASAAETAAMSSEITAGTQQMSTAASEMAQTSGDLSHQAGEMARAIAESAVDAAGLMRNATQLATGARDGVERNTALRALAATNRERLDAGAAALDDLGADAARSAESAEALVTASEEIRAFVTLVQKIARQSKLLALNASMEAARAGAHGEGFAVVAAEIRKLSANSAEAGERTEAVVRDLLAQVAETRDASLRTRETLRTVRQVTRGALDSFAEVERAVNEAEGWVAEIEHSVGESTALVVQATHRLDALARGTEHFAAAMEQVAAGSQQQSASTQEITAAANALAEAARTLFEHVSRFRLEVEDAATAGPTTELPAITSTVEAPTPGPTRELPATPHLIPGS